MIAYKGFNADMTCTLGNGSFQYETGKTYKEDTAKCANTGFHCCEEPIEVLNWYSGKTCRYCIVEASGDINEDGHDKISCTQMTLIKEISKKTLAILECQWMLEHPDRKYSNQVQKKWGTAEKDDVVIVRGRNPEAAGELGSTIFLCKEDKAGNITQIGVYEIDGVNYKPDVFYRADGRRSECKKTS